MICTNTASKRKVAARARSVEMNGDSRSGMAVFLAYE